MKQEAYDILKTAIAEHRELLLSGRQTCLGLLRDYGGRDHPEVNLFAEAVEENIPDRLLRSQPITQQIIDSLAQNFASKNCYDPQVSNFVVSSWADALELYSIEPAIFTNARTPPNTESPPGEQASITERAWYYQDGTTTAGPVLESQLSTLVKSGSINAEVLVWSDGMADWDKASKYFPHVPMPPQMPPASQIKTSQPRNFAPTPNTPITRSSGHDSPYSPPQTSTTRYHPHNVTQMSWSQVLWSFKGRIPRRTYWQATVIWMAIMIVAAMLTGSGAGGNDVLIGLLVFPFIWSSLALQVKRWHDRDKPGSMVLINLIPYIGGIWSFIECGCLPGTIGDNKYGNDPNRN